MNPNHSYILFSLGTEKYATSDVGYIGVLGHWIKAMKESSELTNSGRVDVKDAYLGISLLDTSIVMLVYITE